MNAPMVELYKAYLTMNVTPTINNDGRNALRLIYPYLLSKVSFAILS
jgi:hypothetical protein